MIPFLASLIRDRLLLARLAGVAVWLGWLISLAVGGWTVDATGHRLGADHVQYFAVGQLLAEGENVYDIETMTTRQKEIGGATWEGVLPFRYPPPYAVFFLPTSRLSYEASLAVWTLLSIAALILSGWLLEVPWRDWLEWGLLFYPVFAAISFGQNSLFSLAILAATASLWLRGHYFLAGLIAGMLLLKPQLLLGVGVLWLIDLRRSWRSLAGLALMGAMWLVVCFVLMPGTTERFLASLRENLALQDFRSMGKVFSSQGFWVLLFPEQDSLTRLLSLMTSLAGLGVFVWFCARETSREILYGGAVLFTMWLTPYVMIYDWSMLLIVAVLVWRARPTEGDRWLVLCALIWLVALVNGPLIQGQLKIMPVALSIALPAVVVTAWQVLISGERSGE